MARASRDRPLCNKFVQTGEELQLKLQVNIRKNLRQKGVAIDSSVINFRRAAHGISNTALKFAGASKFASRIPHI